MIDNFQTATVFMMKHHLGQLPTPKWLQMTYEMHYIGKGTYGIVVEAKTRLFPQDLAIKFTFGSEEDAMREAAIQALLTKLYTGYSDDFTVLCPIVKSYDWGTTIWHYTEAYDFIKPLLKGQDKQTKREVSRILATKGEKESMPITSVVMELIQGSTFHHYLATEMLLDPFYLSDDSIITIILQIILTLDSISAVLTFSHGDLAARNIMIIKHPQNTILHYNVSSTEQFNIKTDYFAKLADFGLSHVEYSGPAYQGKDKVVSLTQISNPYIHMDEDDESFKPWADFHVLALSILGTLSYDRLRTMSPGLAKLIASMMITEWPDDYPNTNENRVMVATLTTINEYLKSKMTGDRKLVFEKDANKRVYYFIPTPRNPNDYRKQGATTRKLLRANADIFSSHLNYVPEKEHRIYDMTMKSGNDTTAVWAPLIPKLSIRWSSLLASPESPLPPESQPSPMDTSVLGPNTPEPASGMPVKPIPAKRRAIKQ